MNRRGFLLTGLGLGVLASTAPAQAAPNYPPVPSAYRIAARVHRVPPTLLFAIALQESVLRVDGRHLPYPWTLNVEGRGERFKTYRAALVRLEALLADGVTSVDCGAMQVNWRYHADKLRSPLLALNPWRNLEAGAQILRERFDETPDWRIATGRYQLIRGAAQPDMLAHAYRLSHPLGEWSIDTSLNAATPVATLKLDYGKHGARVSVIERLRGMSGWLTLVRLEVTAFETTEALLFSGLTDDGQVLDQEACEKLMAIPAAGKPTPLSTTVPEALLANSQRAVAATIARVLEANQRLFNEERDKLERWADDKLLAAEEALKNTKARIAQLKRDARKAVTLQEQDGIQRELSELERKQRRLRQEIFAVEDEIIAKRDELIASLQQRLQEKTSNETLFSVRWQVT